MSSAVILGVTPVHVISRLGSLAFPGIPGATRIPFFGGGGDAVPSLGRAGLSRAAATGVFSSWGAGVSLRSLLLLSTGSGARGLPQLRILGSRAQLHGCGAQTLLPCGMWHLSGSGTETPCLLRRPAESVPLSRQGSPSPGSLLHDFTDEISQSSFLLQLKDLSWIST